MGEIVDLQEDKNNKTLKIVQINAVYEYSSTGRTTTEMHEYLRKNGVDSYVFCTNINSPSNNIFSYSSSFDQKLHAVLSRLSGLQAMFSYLSTQRMISKLKAIKPDVVHLRVLHSNCINLPLLLKYLAKEDIATVITLHDCWYFTGHCCYFIDSKCGRWKSGCGNCPDTKKWNPSLFFDNSYYMLKTKERLFNNIERLAVVGVSNWVTDFIEDSILKKSKIIKRIYNWIDVDLFVPLPYVDIRAKHNLSKDDFVVLSVAQQWTSTKGLGVILKAAEKCRIMKFLIIGNIPNIKLPDNIIRVGVLSNTKELASYYATADVFLNPSIRETFGKVTAEALSCGTPAVVYNATATPELIGDGCGYVVEIGDIDGVVRALNYINENGKEKYTYKCRNHVVENYKKEIILQQYMDLYYRLIK